MDITNFVSAGRDNALLLGDYDLYRRQLSRRLLKIQRKLGRATPKGRKYTAKDPVTAEDLSSNEEFSRLLLVQSERAWANAMHMKSTHSADASAGGISRSAKRHVISKFHKASTYALHLTDLLKQLESSQGKTDYLEAQAYASSLLGAVEFEKRSWVSCLVQYSVARIIYAVLVVRTKNESMSNILSNTIDPTIRYAAYQHGLPRTLAIPSVAKKFFPESNASLREDIEELDPDVFKDEADASKGLNVQSENPKTISWRTRMVNIEDASISQCLGAVAKAEVQLSQFLGDGQHEVATASEKAAAYDSVIGCSQDAADATKSAIDELVSESVSQEDSRMQALQVTRTAVNYALIEWRVGRNRMLCGEHDGAVLLPERRVKPRKPRKDGKPVEQSEGTGKKLARLRERVVLYNGIIQSIGSVEELPGVAADVQFTSELQIKRSYFEALRNLSLARAHILLSAPTSALALLALASNQCETIRSFTKFNDTTDTLLPPKLEVTETQAVFLQETVSGLLRKYHALVAMDTLTTTVESPAFARHKQRPLVERLKEWPCENGVVDLANLVRYPPAMEPIPVKPLFFDTAWTYIDYPGKGKSGEEGLEETDVEQGEEKKPAKRGWFGFGRS